MKLKISTILARANKAQNDIERAAIIRENSSATLKAILGMSFDPRVKWLIPEGPVTYKPAQTPPDTMNERLYVEHRRLYIFVDGGHQSLKQDRRETLFAELLENLDPEDAHMMLYVKEKKLDELYPNITYNFVRSLYKKGLASHWEPVDPRVKKPANVTGVSAPLTVAVPDTPKAPPKAPIKKVTTPAKRKASATVRKKNVSRAEAA